MKKIFWEQCQKHWAPCMDLSVWHQVLDWSFGPWTSVEHNNFVLSAERVNFVTMELRNSPGRLVTSAAERAIGNQELKKLSPYSFPMTVCSSKLSNKYNKWSEKSPCDAHLRKGLTFSIEAKQQDLRAPQPRVLEDTEGDAAICCLRTGRLQGSLRARTHPDSKLPITYPLQTL